MQDLQKDDFSAEAGGNFYDLQLVVTGKCNLSCTYCYVLQNKSFMPLETAQQAVKEGLEKAEARQLALMVSFMGGEPMLAFPMIRDLCEWAWETFPDRNIFFCFPTNGTVLTEEMRQWLTRHRDRVTAALSYDSAYFQNVNRTRAAQRTEVDFFRQLWPKQRFKMTISENNVSDLAAGIISMEQAGIPFAANVAFGEPEWRDDSFALFARELRKLTVFYAMHKNLLPCDLFDINFQLVFLPRMPMLRRCGIGQNYENIDCDGKSYPCHMVSPLTMNKAAAESAKIYDFPNRDEFNVTGCEACPLNQMCPKCYGMSYLRCQDPFRVDINVCKTFKMQAKAACILTVKRLYAKGEIEEEDRLTISAIKRVAREMGWDLSANSMKEMET